MSKTEIIKSIKDAVVANGICELYSPEINSMLDYYNYQVNGK